VGFGIHGAGILPVSRLGGSLGPYIYNFDLGDITFSDDMAVRAGAKAFDTAPIFQGKWDGTGTPDAVSFSRGTLLGNQTQYFYSNFDPYQGSISFWITLEWAGNDGIEHNILYASANYRLYKSTGNALVLIAGGQTYTGPSTAAWTAGTTYHLVASWDAKNTLDGTNYARWSVNDAHTYSVTTQPTASAPGATVGVGSTITPTLAADAQISGLFVWRRVLYDGTYGVGATFDESGLVDEIAAVYAAGAGADPAQVVGGSWDCTFCLPTDQSEGALATTGQAWSHPYGSELIDVPFLDDGGLPGTDYAVEFNGTSTYIGCGSDASIDDIPSGAEMTVAGWVRLDSTAASTFTIIHKGDALTTGWVVYVGVDGQLYGYVPLATDNMQCTVAVDIGDGKWHYFAFHYDDTTKTGTISVDGVWGASDTGIGAYQSDAASDLEMGRLTALSSFWDGGIAWIEISDNDRHTAGTDFIPPRAPYADGNTVEYWLMDEGTGATAAASVTSPNNDGTITNGSWSAIWAIVGTPVIPQSLEFDGAATILNGTSGANIDNLPSGANGFTAEGYFRHDTAGESNGGIFWTKTGWYMQFASATTIRVFIDYDTTDINETFSWTPDGRQHHWMLTYNENGVDRFARVYRDGILVHTTAASVGNYVADAAQTLYIGNNAGATATMDGAIGWQALSDNVRTGATFIANSRVAPRANDANMHLRYAMTDGAGTAVADTSGNAYNGTITMGSGAWNNTPDLKTDEPGAMIYEQGYNVGSDGANDGIYIPTTLTAATDYVIRVPLQYSPNAWPRITLYDVTAVGSIVDFDAPPMTAVHDGGAGAAAFTSTGEVYPASLIGGTIYNVTDGSSGTITAVGGTNQDTITAALAGGGSNDWQVGEQAYIVPPDGWVFNEPIVARTSANTAYEVRITNRNSDGVITVHQAEVLESLLDNGDHESLNGGFPGAPELITGWTNYLLDAGDTEPEATVVHSGAQSLEWNASASDEGMYLAGSLAVVGGYYSQGVWCYCDGSARIASGSPSSARAVRHNVATTGPTINSGTGQVWTPLLGVFRAKNTDYWPLVFASSGAAGDRFSDDTWLFACDSVTLTVTPASQVNSLETPAAGNPGIRVDGRDSCTVPAATHKMLATSGGVRFRVTPRHSIANSEAFGQDWEVLFDLTEDANNYVMLYRDNAAGGTLYLEVDQAGAGPWGDSATPAWAADTEASIDVINYGGLIRVLFDGLPLLEIGGLTGFATDFTAAAYFGSEDTPNYQADAVISPP